MFEKSDLRSFRSATVGLPKLARKVIPYSNVPLALVGFTPEREVVKTYIAKNFAEKNNMSYFELNLTDEIAIENVMRHLTRLALAAKSRTS